MDIKIKHTITLIAALGAFVLSPAQAAEQCPVHKLTISEIKNIVPASGQTELGGILLNELVSFALTPAGHLAKIGALSYYVDDLIFDKQSLPEATRADWLTFANAADPILSFQDDLMVYFNGVNVIPGAYPYEVILDPDANNGEVRHRNTNFEDLYQPTYQRTRLVLNKSFSFYKEATLDLIEWDGGTFGSGHDDMGSILFSEPENGLPYETTLTVTKACGSVEEILGIEVPWGCKDEAVYEVSYKVEPNQGKLEDIPERLLCGKNICADARNSTAWDDRSFYSTTSIKDLRSCPPAYTTRGGMTEVDGENYRVCELIPNLESSPTVCGASFQLLTNINTLNDGDIIVMKSRTVATSSTVNSDYLANSQGQYLARCQDCVPGAAANLRDNAVVHVIDPNRTAAQWTVKKLADNKFALRSETGKYLARCDGCIPGVAGDSAFIHVSDPTQPSAQFTIEPGADFTKFTLRSDNAKYLSPCFGCVPDQNRLGHQFNGSLHLTDSSNISAGWEISVKAKSPIDPVIYSANRSFDADISVKPSEIWLVDTGEVLTINSGATLRVDNGAEIQNNGTIINNGTLIVGDLGEINNQQSGIIVNNENIRNEGGLINNAGIIDNANANNLANNGSIVNSGRLFTQGLLYPARRYTGSNPSINLPVFGYFMGAVDSGKYACEQLKGNWTVSTDTIFQTTHSCSVTSPWLTEDKTLMVGTGVKLIINGSMTNSGHIINSGSIDNSNGTLKQCNKFDGLPVSTPSQVEEPCIISDEAAQCSSYGGTWHQTIPNRCDLASGETTVAENSILTIRSGIKWYTPLGNTLNNHGVINIEGDGEIYVTGKIVNDDPNNSRSAVINNHGLIYLNEDSGSGQWGMIENHYQIDNYGIIDKLHLSSNIIGSIGVIDNRCDAIYTLDRTYTGYPEEQQNIITDHNCLDTDTDDDGIDDENDALPRDPTETNDADGDGVGDNADAFPNDRLESKDTDGDNIGDNADAFPLNLDENKDTDGDCGVISTQTATSGNGCGDNSDEFPLNPFETKDSDNDCGVISTQTVTSGSRCGDNSDAFPDDATESRDSDNDGVGDVADAFPNDADNSRLVTADNSNGWALTTAVFSTSTTQAAIPGGLPAGASLPQGIVVFELNGGTIGSESVVTITYPTALDSAMVWWKYGPTASDTTPHWYVFDGAVISGNTVTLTLKDGGAGDDDLTENGSISDPGGPGLPANEPPASDTSSGAVSLWFLLLLPALYLRRLRNARV